MFAFQASNNCIGHDRLYKSVETHSRRRSQTYTVVYCQVDCVEIRFNKTKLQTLDSAIRKRRQPRRDSPHAVLARRGPIREARKRRLSLFFVVARRRPIREYGDCPFGTVPILLLAVDSSPCSSLLRRARWSNCITVHNDARMGQANITHHFYRHQRSKEELNPFPLAGFPHFF